MYLFKNVRIYLKHPVLSFLYLTPTLILFGFTVATVCPMLVIMWSTALTEEVPATISDLDLDGLGRFLGNTSLNGPE